MDSLQLGVAFFQMLSASQPLSKGPVFWFWDAFLLLWTDFRWMEFVEFISARGLRDARPENRSDNRGCHISQKKEVTTCYPGIFCDPKRCHDVGFFLKKCRSDLSDLSVTKCEKGCGRGAAAKSTGVVWRPSRVLFEHPKILVQFLFKLTM